MNKGDLINEVANIVNTKKSAQEAVDCMLASITKTLKKGEDVTLTGFGTFKVVKRKARKTARKLALVQLWEADMTLIGWLESALEAGDRYAYLEADVILGQVGAELHRRSR